MKKIFFMALAAIALGACNSEPKFKVEGEVSGADGKMLYLEASALEGIVPLDSVKLEGDGSFHFKQVRPVSPEFYRLRVDDKVINFSVDSTETVLVKAPYTDFATAYTVEGSPNSSKIKDLTLKQMKLQDNVNALLQSVQAHKIGADVFEDSLASLLKNYKDEVKISYIFAAPNTAAAYFALFQKLNNYLIFDPLNNKEDIKCFCSRGNQPKQLLSGCRPLQEPLQYCDKGNEEYPYSAAEGGGNPRRGNFRNRHYRH